MSVVQAEVEEYYIYTASVRRSTCNGRICFPIFPFFLSSKIAISDCNFVENKFSYWMPYWILSNAVSTLHKINERKGKRNLSLIVDITNERTRWSKIIRITKYIWILKIILNRCSYNTNIDKEIKKEMYK